MKSENADEWFLWRTNGMSGFYEEQKWMGASVIKSINFTNVLHALYKLYTSEIC